MSRELLSNWLDVPASPWPPDHYALLGLAPGRGDTDDIEHRVLERMEGLRRYQLLHPDAVTEGMNLLARAMLCLTDPQARRDYDRGREAGGSPPAAEPAPPEEEDVPVVEVIEVPEYVPPPPRPTAAPVSPQPPPSARVTVYSLDDEPAEEVFIPELVEEPPQVLPEDEPELDGGEDEREARRERRAERAWPLTVADEQRAYRRGIYAEIARIRKVLHVWERLRAFLDEPDKAFSRRTETVAFMNCLADLRPLLASVHDIVGNPDQPGHLVAILARQALVVEMFRSLLPSQRDALAKDCRSAHYLLTERYAQLRQEVRELTAKGFGRRVLLPVLRQVIARPEWLLLFIGIIALMIAFVRSLPT